jgi:hypothetical protein
MSQRLCSAAAVIGAAAVVLVFALVRGGSEVSAQTAGCDMRGYKADPGLTARAEPAGVYLDWSATHGGRVSMRLAIENGTPRIRDISIVGGGGRGFRPVLTNAIPDFRVVSGFRRMSNQQLQPLVGLAVPITPKVIEDHKWDAFWDAPLNLEQQPTNGGNPPPGAGIAGQPGLPRKPDEVRRDAVRYHVTGCEVKTNGSRIEVWFPGVQLGVFDGRLQFTIYKGTNLIRQEIVATTNEPSVAYKYDAGLSGVALRSGTRMAWRDPSENWRDDRLGGAAGPEADIKTANRLLIAEMSPGESVAVFPPPHTFFWARELATNLGYSWYRKDSATAFSFGIRQAEKEESAQYAGNFALYSARPGTEQHMAVYLYPSDANAPTTLEPVLAFTHGDHYKPLAGYQVMNHHYHMDLGQRLLTAGSLDAPIPDLVALKALGITIVSQIDSVGTEGGGGGTAAARGGAADQAAQAGRGAQAAAAPAGGRGGRRDQLEITKASVDGARLHSDPNFLVMPDQEFYGSPLGGHTDLLFSHPVYWRQGRAADEPLVENDATYGRVYHIGNADDLMEMVKREDVLISMPHPRTKGSTGFPDAVKDRAFFKDPHYQGVGFRWGMGLDLSERRLCELRCLPLLDDMSNWVADLPIPPKYIMAISEARYQSPGDDIYASAPVSYIKLASVPPANDPSPVIQTLMRGDYFVTSGEVLIPSYTIQGTGNQRTVVADIEWTFPLEFIELVWGDGTRTGGQVIYTPEQPALGSHRFQIPFDATGKKWVRFAAWDSAGNGAMLQPVKLGRSGR